MSKKGHNYENTIVKNLYWDTAPHVFVARCGYSGNGALPQPDFLILDTAETYGVELKKRSPKRNKDGTYSPVTALDEDDITQLNQIHHNGVTPVVAIKFSNRELLVFEWRGFDESGIPDCFEPREVNGKLKLRKPQTDDWPSAQKGDSDIDVFCDTLSLSQEDVITND